MKTIFRGSKVWLWKFQKRDLYPWDVCHRHRQRQKGVPRCTGTCITSQLLELLCYNEWKATLLFTKPKNECFCIKSNASSDNVADFVDLKCKWVLFLDCWFVNVFRAFIVVPESAMSASHPCNNH